MLRLLLALFGKPRSPHWSAVRRSWLKGNGSCIGCGTTAKLEVHHVVPFDQDPSRELDLSNLMTLCEGRRHCHFRLGHHGNWRLWNPNVRADAVAQFIKIHGSC